MKISQVAAVTGSAAAVLAIGVGIALATQPHKPAPVRQQIVQVGDASTPTASPTVTAKRVVRPAAVVPKVAPSTEEESTPVDPEPTVSTSSQTKSAEHVNTVVIGGQTVTVAKPPPLPPDLNPAPPPEPGTPEPAPSS